MALSLVLFLGADKILSATTNCVDSDGGKIFNIKGTVTYLYNGLSRSATDYCFSDTSLVERYCAQGSAFNMTQVCEYGCDVANSVCKASPAVDNQENPGTTTGGDTTTGTGTTGTQVKCSETDSGNNIWKYGILNDPKGGQKFDYCVGSGPGSSVGEYYCTGDYAYTFAYFRCDYGCESGACKTRINFTSPLSASSANTKLNFGSKYDIVWQGQGSIGKNISLDIYKMQFRPEGNFWTTWTKVKTLKLINISDTLFSGSLNGWTNDLAVNDDSHGYAFVMNDLALVSGETSIVGYQFFQVVSSGGVEGVGGGLNGFECTDSDGGVKAFTKGTVSTTAGQSYVDVCNVNYVKEYFCDGANIRSNDVYCSAGCSNGSCNIDCTDSDNGKDIFTKGFLSRKSTSVQNYDSCTSSNTKVIENFCNAETGLIDSEIIDCKNGCIDGACKLDCNPDWQAREWSSCSSATLTQTREYYDKNNCNITKDKPATETRNCSIIDVNNTGDNTNNLTCTDTDNGRNYFTRGITYLSDVLVNRPTDVCSADRKSLTEYYCEEGVVKSEIVPCQNGCLNGVCNSSCTDSDNGKVYNIKGTTVYGSSTVVDKCYDKNPKWLQEYYCDVDGVRKYEWKFCSLGCDTEKAICRQAENTCEPNWNCTAWSTCSNSSQVRTCTDSNNCGVTTNKPAETQSCGTSGSCSDSDTGKDYFTKGFTINAFNQRSDDSCSGNDLTEYYCKNDGSGASMFEIKKCDYGIGAYKCENGACVATTCTPNWTCTAWSTCSNSSQVRTCTDSNNCGVTTNKPAETQSCSVSQTCTDPDGKDYFRKETLVYRGTSYADRCDSRYPNHVLEYYCDSTGTGKAEWGSCPNGCDGDGACRPVDTCTPTWMCGPWGACSNSSQSRTCVQGNCVNQVGTKTENRSCNVTGACTDSDDGKNYYKEGIVTEASGNTYDDICTGNRLLEYYCDGNSVGVEEKLCICKNNKACNQAVLCEDSDGKNYFTDGFVLYSGNLVHDYCSGDLLQERYCTTAGTQASETIRCQYGCNNSNKACNVSSTCSPNWTCGAFGVCRNGTWERTCTQTNCPYLEKTKTETQSCATCNESDGGEVYSIKGVLNYIDIAGKTETKEDVCIDSSNYGKDKLLKEYYCQTVGGYTHWTSKEKLCENGCINGSCNTHTECQNQKCVSVSGTGSNSCTFGNDSTCSGGNGTCTDTDGGKDYFVRGEVNAFSATGNRKVSDSCSGNYLTEEYCEGGIAKTEANHWCADGCSNGACIAPVCSETDSGRDYFNPGVTTGSNGERHYDVCANGILGEFYCGSDNRTAFYESVTCGEGCDSSNKACKQTVPTCTESDNGKDYLVKGTTSILTGSSLMDQCLDAYQLQEYYCASPAATAISTEFKNCENGCANGFCKPGVSQSCVDPDGKNYNRKETMAYLGLTYTDYCDSRFPGYVVEYYCNDEGVGKAQYGSCGNSTCFSGACK